MSDVILTSKYSSQRSSLFKLDLDTTVDIDEGYETTIIIAAKSASLSSQFSSQSSIQERTLHRSGRPPYTVMVGISRLTLLVFYPAGDVNRESVSFSPLRSSLLAPSNSAAKQPPTAVERQSRSSLVKGFLGMFTDITSGRFRSHMHCFKARC